MDDLTLLIGMIDRELGMARSGEGYESGPVAYELVANHVAPLLAEARAEQDLLLWLHAESEWKREAERSSRQAWAEEAVRLDALGPDKEKVLGLVNAALWSRVAVIDDYETADGKPLAVVTADDLPGVIAELDRRWDAPGFRPHKVVGPPDGTVCACVPDDEVTALVDAGWSLPQCTVHPEGGRE